jgi:aminoglycoside 3-N-acetyltransferase
VEQGAPLTVDGRRRWVTFEALFYDSDDFGRLGEDVERDTDMVVTGRVGAATARLMRMRPVVDYGVAWLERVRGATEGGRA